MMLEIHNLHARLADGREILKGIDLAVAEGDVHYLGHDLLTMPADERAREGVFLAFQYPVEIPGVNNTYFLRAAVNAQRRHRGDPELDAGQFLRVVRAKLKLLDIGDDLLQRAVNVGFSITSSPTTSTSCRTAISCSRATRPSPPSWNDSATAPSTTRRPETQQ